MGTLFDSSGSECSDPFHIRPLFVCSPGLAAIFKTVHSRVLFKLQGPSQQKVRMDLSTETPLLIESFHPIS